MKATPLEIAWLVLLPIGTLMGLILLVQKQQPIYALQVLACFGLFVAKAVRIGRRP
jgi:hypothetical protein